MSVSGQPWLEGLSLPEVGAVRVHPEPAALPRLRHEGPGRNRFDDPFAAFAVRYAADTLAGCLIETMARFRPDPTTEHVLADIQGVDDDPCEPLYTDPSRGLAEWLAAQHVGRLQITSPAPLLVDIEQPELLDLLDTHPQVRAALEASGLGTRAEPARLDAGVIRLGEPIGRRVTQAAARAVYEFVTGPSTTPFPSTSPSSRSTPPTANTTTQSAPSPADSRSPSTHLGLVPLAPSSHSRPCPSLFP